METYAVIASYRNPKEAYYLKFKLELEGINAYLVDPVPGFDSEQKSPVHPLKVQVNIHEVEKAVQVVCQVYDELKTTSIDEQIKKMKRILVPIDFSKNSLTACLFAFSLAQNLNAEIKLLHVYNDPFVDSGYIHNRISYEKFSRNVLFEIQEMAQKNIVGFLDELKEKLKELKLNDVKFHYNLQGGKPEYQIIKTSESYKPYIIILGTQGTGKMPNDIIGSVATKVIENTTVPLLAIPENWSYTSFEKLNILYATDFHDSDFSAFHKLIEILKPFNVKFDCVHIESNENNPWKEMQMFKLESHLNKTFEGVPIKCHLINHTKIFDGIQMFVDKANIDVISFTSPKRSILYKLIFPNNLKKMVYQSKTPLLIFHTDDNKVYN